MYTVRPTITSAERTKLSKYSDLLANLLFYRGYPTNEQAEKFINSDYDMGIHDPFLLKDIDFAIERILKAVKEKEKICIYSDYDADGIPGAVVLSDFFRKIGFENFFVYIPHRNKEGFGLNTGAILEIAERETKLIITVDCGTVDVEPINLAYEKNMDVIVTDHHDPNNHKTKAVAVINPKQFDCKYPDKNLCGSGVVFKLVQALIKKGGEDKIFSIKDGYEKWLLDMVGIATLSDMVPLIGENRVFAKYGILVMRKSPRIGFLRLLSECKVDQKKITEEDVGFSITPRINAASRMGEPEMAYKMLFTDDETEADKLVKHLHKINDDRKGAVSAMVKEIKKDIGEKFSGNVIVKGNPKWQPSLLGLAASSIVSKYKKPVFLWGRGDGKNFKGSCRSDGTVNLVQIMNHLPKGIIYEFGGHEMAGGFAVSDDGIFSLESELQKSYEVVKKENSSGVDIFTKIADACLQIDDVNWSMFNDIQKMAPFGVQNEKPLFLFEKVKIADASMFGKEKNHLKLIFKKTSGQSVEAIKFFAGEEFIDGTLPFITGQEINMAAHIEKNDFGRMASVRLRIVDLW